MTFQFQAFTRLFHHIVSLFLQRYKNKMDVSEVA